jgi:hypothetical protein
MIVPFGFLAAVAEQLLGKADARRHEVGEVRLHFTDHGVEWAEDDAGLRRFEHDGIAGRDAIELAKFSGDGNPSAFAELGMNDMIHEIAYASI